VLIQSVDYQAKPIASAKALYDYTANGDGELTITEDEPLSVYEQEEEWILVKSNKPGGKAGYVPATYIELVNPLCRYVGESNPVHLLQSGSVEKDQNEEDASAAASVPSPPVTAVSVLIASSWIEC
jgi:hypothetical protein